MRLKTAYRPGGHVQLLQKTLDTLGQTSPGVRSLIIEGNIATDKGIRHPWIPTNDILHSMPTRSRKSLRSKLKELRHSAVQDIASAAAKPDAALASIKTVRGLMNLGQAQHALMDVAPHYEAPARNRSNRFSRQLRKIIRKTPDAGVLGWVASAAEHVEEGLTPKAFGAFASRLDDIDPDKKEWKDSSHRARTFGKTVRREIISHMKSKGLSRKMADKKLKAVLQGPAPQGLTLTAGRVSRDINFLGGQALRPVRAVTNIISGQ